MKSGKLRGQRRSFASRSAIRFASARSAGGLLAMASGLTGAALLTTSQARADVYGNTGGPDLSAPANWTNETATPTDTAPPAASDIARWDNNSSGGTFNLSVGTAWLGIQIANPTAAVTIGTTGDIGNTLNIGASGVDLSAATQNLTIVSNTTLGAAQTWNIASGRTLTQSGTLNTNGSALLIQGAGNVSSAGAVSGGGSITMSGTGTLSLTKANSYSGGTTINSGIVAMSTNTSLGSGPVTMNGGQLTIAGAGSSAMSNSVSITTGDTATIAGSGTEEVSGSYTGGGTLNLSFGSGATFDLTSTSAFTSFTGTIEMGSSAGAIRYGGSSSGGSMTHTTVDLGTSTGSFNNRLGGSIGIGALEGGSSTVLTGSSSANDATTFSIGGAGINTVFNGSITTGSFGSGASVALTIVGGSLALAGNGNTYAGATTINSGATLQIGNGGTTGSVGSAGITNNSVLAFDPGSSGAFTINNAISGSGVVNHIGAGTTTLTGNNSYSGGTNISMGTLVANNATSALGSGAVAVNGGTLAGVGTIGAAVTVNSTGQLTAGSGGIGTLSMASLTLNSGSIVNEDFSTSGPTNLINITTSNGLTVNGGGINLYATGNAPLNLNGTYNIFQFPSAYTLSVPSNLLTVLNPAAGTPTYTWGTSGNDITLTVSGLSSVAAWNSSSGGSWNTAADWTASVPNGAGSIASFGSSPGLTAPATITLDGNKTVGSLIFNNSAGNSSTPPTTYTIAQGSGETLTIDNGASPAQINDLNGSHLISAPVVLNATAAVAITNSTDSLTLSGGVSGSGGITLSGAGTLVLSGSNTYLGATNISSGTLVAGSGGATGALPAGAITDNGTLAFNISATTIVSNTISGTGGVTQLAAAKLVLGAANAYSGTTNVSSGTVQQGVSGAIGTGNLIVASTGILDLNGFNTSVGSISGAGLIDNVSAGGAITLTTTSGSSTTFSGSIQDSSGSVSLVKAGGGALTLMGVNTYTGTTNVSAGTLVIGTGGSVAGGALSGQGFQVSGGTLNVSAASTLNAAANDFLETAGTVTLGAISSNNNDTALFNLSGGTFSATSLTIPRSAAFTTAPTAAAPLAGVTNSGFYVHGSANASIGTLAVGTGNSSASIRIDNGTLTVTGELEVGATDDGSSRWTILQVNGGTLNSTDTANGIVVSQNGFDPVKSAFNACNGQIYLSAGVINAQKIGFGLASDTVAGGKGFLIIGGGTLYMGSGGIVQNDTVGYTTTIDLTSGTIGANANWSSALPMALTGSSFTFQAANASGGASNISLGGALSNSGGLIKTGAGALNLSGTDTYSGGTTVSAGQLVLASAGAFPSASSLTIAPGATLQVASHGANPTYVPVVSSLTNNGTIDLVNNAMVVQNASASLGTMSAQVAAGFNGGAWNGTGNVITSSAAASDTTHLTAVGIITGLTTFEGLSVNSTDVLMKDTYYGDTDLSGVVDGSDYSRIDTAYLNNQNVSNTALTGWYNGDFNYDGVVNGSDYTLIDNGFNRQGASLAAEVATPTAQIAGTSAVPEPASIALMLAPMAMLLRRRRRFFNNGPLTTNN